MWIKVNKIITNLVGYSLVFINFKRSDDFFLKKNSADEGR